MPADDDEMTPDVPDEELDDEVDPDLVEEPDVEELDEADEVVFGLEEDDDGDSVVDEPDVEEDDDVEEVDDSPAGRAKRRAATTAADEEEDEDEELLSPDDVEADLDRILKDRLVTVEEEEDEDEEEPDERGDPGDRLQPKRADEQLCSNCFLLVRANAPGCPVGDDACPIFT